MTNAILRKENQPAVQQIARELCDLIKKTPNGAKEFGPTLLVVANFLDKPEQRVAIAQQVGAYAPRASVLEKKAAEAIIIHASELPDAGQARAIKTSAASLLNQRLCC